jgi:nucleotide-binding universal stress UspA family protein
MRIVIAIDGSPASEAVFAQLGRTFRLPETIDDLTVVTVHDSTASDNPLPVINALGLLSPFSEASAQAALDQARTALGPLADQAHFVQIDGVPGPELVHFVRTHRTDLLIVGRGKVHDHDRILLGSVSSHVTANAPCTVIVVK